MIGLYFTLYEYYKVKSIHLEYTPVMRYAVTGAGPCFAYPCFSFTDADGSVDPTWVGTDADITKFSSYNDWKVTPPN